jgi:hypothetical protein
MVFEIVHSTPEERTRVWTAGVAEWGQSMGAEVYVRRETHLSTIATGRNGRMSYWVLTEKDVPSPRPLLSTMESLHRRMLVARPNQPVFEAASHGIASVLTFPEHRGHGYATKLLTGVGESLRTHEGFDIRTHVPSSEQEYASKLKDVSHTPVACSMLFSDVGDFYAPMGWARFPSKHVTVPFDQPAPAQDLPPARPIGIDDLPVLCSRDEELVRARLSQPADVDVDARKTRVAVVPDIDLIGWHINTENYSTAGIFSRTPTVRGAIWTRNPDGSGPRIWILIKRNYYGDASEHGDSREDNTIHVLRLVIDEAGATDVTEDELARGLEAILRIAIQEGKEWRTKEVELWNPSERVLGMIRSRGMRGEIVNREQHEIMSMMWYGNEGGENVEWLENEKYTWC